MSAAQMATLTDDMPTTVLFGPAPDGMDLTANHRVSMITSVAVLLAISALSVGARVAARLSQNIALAADDYLIIVAWIFALLCGISTMLTCLYGGVGEHIYVLTIGTLKEGYKIDYAYEFLYATTLPCVKLSILLFYHRLFPVRRFTLALYGVGAIVVAWWFSVILTTFLQCRPFKFLWTMYTNPTGGHCINIYNFHFGIALANIVTDVVILVLPMPIVWNLQMPRSQRFILIGIFFLGSFACVASAIRLHDLTYDKTGLDITWWNVRPLIWSTVEPCVAIISACLPTLRPLLRSFFPQWFAIRGSSGSRRKSTQRRSSGGNGSDTTVTSRSYEKSSTDFLSPVQSPIDEVHLRPDLGSDRVRLTNEFTVRVGAKAIDHSTDLEQGWPMEGIRVDKEVLVKEGRLSKEALTPL